jgi:hypothetical protein
MGMVRWALACYTARQGTAVDRRVDVWAFWSERYQSNEGHPGRKSNRYVLGGTVEASFKVKNLPMIAGYIFGNLWILYLIIWGHAPDLRWTGDLSKVIPAGVASTIVAVALTELIGGDWKARLVFRKWTNPLPGSEAFTEYGPNDARVDMDVLKKRFGALPKENAEQNRLWYKILKLNETRPSVAYAHQYWLLMRDLASITPFLIVATGIAAYVKDVPPKGWGVAVAMLIAELLLAIGSACSLGEDLVRNVLAEESAKP